MSEPIMNLVNMQPTGLDAASADGSRSFRPYASMASKDTLCLNIPVRTKKSTLTKVKDYGTGILKGGLNTITGLLTPTGMMLALGTVGLSAVTGGAALPFLAAAGMGVGAFQMVKGALKGDWEQAGEGTFAFAISALGTKSATRKGQPKNASAVMVEKQPSALQGVKTGEPIVVQKNHESPIASKNALTNQERKTPPPKPVLVFSENTTSPSPKVSTNSMAFNTPLKENDTSSMMASQEKRIIFQENPESLIQREKQPKPSENITSSVNHEGRIVSESPTFGPPENTTPKGVQRDETTAFSNAIVPVKSEGAFSPGTPQPKSFKSQVAKNGYSKRQFLALQGYTGLLTGNLNSKDDKSGE